MKRPSPFRISALRMSRSRGLVVLLLVGLSASAEARERPSPLQAHLTVTVVDENGRPISGTRLLLERVEGGVVREAETDQVGRSVFSDLAAGTYRLRAEKERFYAVTVPDIRFPENAVVEIVLPREQEFVEVVEVTPSTPTLDPWRTTARVELSAPEILMLPTPVMRDLRYALAVLPNVVQDASGNLHIAGSAETQTLAMLDGFTVTHPMTGHFDLRVSVDAIGEVQIHSSRYSAEYGRGSGGVLALTTLMGDDRFRFSATDVIPSVQNRKGFHLNSWTPRATFSGPLRKKRAWFYNAFEGEYDVTLVEDLPRDADRNQVWRWSHLAKVQANFASAHLLTFTVLLNRFRSPYDGLSRFVPREATRHVVHEADLLAVKGQTYWPDGLVLEYGVGATQFRRSEHPWGEAPYLLFPEGPRGNFFRTRENRAHRWQGIVNLTLPSFNRRGRHEVKVGMEWHHLGAWERVQLRPITIFREGGTRARTVHFLASPGARMTNVELGLYGQNRWFFSSRGVFEFGLRFDWDSALGAKRWSPRAAASYLLTADRRTKLVGGIGLFHDATNLERLLRPLAGRRWDVFHAADDREARGRDVRARFFDQARDLDHSAVVGARGDDAVARRLLGGHFHDRDDVALGAPVHLQHLREAGHRRVDQIVDQHHREGLAADQVTRAPDRVAEAFGLLLAGVDELARLRRFAEQGFELGPTTAPGERLEELDGPVEMVLDQSLAAARDEDDLLDPGGPCLLDRVLHDRFVDDRQHLLGQDPRRREHAGAEPRHR